jgi:hypothetical protein
VTSVRSAVKKIGRIILSFGGFNDGKLDFFSNAINVHNPQVIEIRVFIRS